MSWSAGAVGRVAAVKAALAKQFTNAKASTAGIPHEQKSVELIEQVVNDQLDFLAGSMPVGAVRVEASGSAWSNMTGGYNNQVKLLVETVAGFIE